MAEITADSVVVDLLARTDSYDADVNNSATTFERASARTMKAANDVERSAARVANAQRNIGRQIADIGTGIAGQQSPFLIFAQQAPQVADALADMGGKAGAVAAFFSGPWGAAILAAASVLGTTLIPKLLESGHEAGETLKRVKALAEGADSFGAAQSLLGRAIDLTTGKLKTQNEVLLEAIRLQALASKTAAAAQEGDARKAVREQGTPSFVQSFGSLYAGFGLPQGNKDIQGIAGRFADGKIDISAARKELDALTKAGRLSEASVAGVLEKFVALGKLLNDQKAAQQVLDALDGKGIASDLKPYKDTSKTDAQKAEKAARERFEAAQRLRALDEQLISSKAELTSDVQEQDQYQRDLINLARDGQIAELAEQRRRKEIGDAEYAARVALVKSISDNKLDLVNRKDEIRLAQENLARALDTNKSQQEVLKAQEDLADTMQQRRDIELQLLDKQIEEQRLRAQMIVDLAAQNKADPRDADRAQATLNRLPQLRELGQQAIDRKYESPLQKYKRNLGSTSTSDQVETLIGQELDYVREGVRNSITKRLGIKDPLLAGIIDMFIQSAIIQPIAKALSDNAGGSGGGGIVGTIASVASLFGRASGGFVSAGQAVRVNESSAPGRVEGFRPTGSGEIIPLGRMKAASPGGGGTTVLQTIAVDARGAVMNDQFAEMILARSGQQAILAAQMGAAGGKRGAMQAISRPRLPGSY